MNKDREHRNFLLLLPYSDLKNFAFEIGKTVFDDIALFLFHRDDEIDVFEQLVRQKPCAMPADIRLARMTRIEKGSADHPTVISQPAEPIVLSDNCFKRPSAIGLRQNIAETNYEYSVSPADLFKRRLIGQISVKEQFEKSEGTLLILRYS